MQVQTAPYAEYPHKDRLSHSLIRTGAHRRTHAIRHPHALHAVARSQTDTQTNAHTNSSYGPHAGTFSGLTVQEEICWEENAEGDVHRNTEQQLRCCLETLQSQS